MWKVGRGPRSGGRVPLSGPFGPRLGVSSLVGGAVRACPDRPGVRVRRLRSERGDRVGARSRQGPAPMGGLVERGGDGGGPGLAGLD